MKKLLQSGVFAVCMGAGPSVAFDVCLATQENLEALQRELRSQVVRRAPVRYHPHARQITLVFADVGDRLMPFATVQQGSQLVVVPQAFVPVMCRIAFATFLDLEGIQEEQYQQAAQDAALCIDRGASGKDCLVNYANDLERYYREAFEKLSEDVQSTAFNISRATLYQIVMHEYAHHFLNHFARIHSGQLQRIDAEFEADLFSVLNGIQAGEPPSAAYYFFAGVEIIEKYSQAYQTQDYESATCRAGNVDHITGVFGIAPMIVLDTAYGGGFVLRRNSPQTFHEIANEYLQAPASEVPTHACSRIAGVALADAQQELKQLLGRIQRDADLLLGDSGQMDVERAKGLLRDLSAMAERSKYVNGIAAKAVALILRKWGLQGRDLAPLIQEQAAVLNVERAGADFLSEDYGRILQAQGLSVLQERSDLAVPLRLQRSLELLGRAVDYNPAQSEAWANLAFIAFKQGDCERARRFAEASAETANRDEDRQSAAMFAEIVGRWQSDAAECRAQGERFHPYPGL